MVIDPSLSEYEKKRLIVSGSQSDADVSNELILVNPQKRCAQI